MKCLDCDWLIIKEFIKFKINEFNEIKLRIYNKPLFIDENFIIKIEETNFIDENLYYYNRYEKDKLNFIRFVNAYNRLSLKDRMIIYWNFIDDEKKYSKDYLANELGYSLGYYFTIKKKVINRFSIALGICTI